MSRPARARIDLAAIRHNLEYARHFAPHARIAAVVKANAYGHGVVPVARTLAERADAFVVACGEEALELRESGIRHPILILEGIFGPDELVQVDREHLTIVVHNQEQLDWVLAARPQQPLHCWIKIDSGMHRVGFAPERFAEVLGQLRDCPHVDSDALVAITHFARADELDQPYTEQQIATFDRAVKDTGVACSLSNSAAVLAWPQAHRDWVRPGILLYGASPFEKHDPAATGLRPAMTLESEVIAIRELSPGEPVGYGGRFVCQRPTRVGVVAMGYADGYPRHAPDGTPVRVAGQPTRLIGRVSMDMLTVDLTDIPQARLGSPVELWGHAVPAAEVARMSGTIPYELFTGLSRVAVRYENAVA